MGFDSVSGDACLVVLLRSETLKTWRLALPRFIPKEGDRVKTQELLQLPVERTMSIVVGKTDFVRLCLKQPD